MARGGFTEKELEALKNNKYVVYVDKSKVVYSNEFKFHFIEEEQKTKKLPRQIFAEAGFDVVALGGKRIERCAARWRESYAAGSLGNYEDSQVRKVNASNAKKERVTQNERIEILRAKIQELNEKCIERRNKYLEAKRELDSFYKERLELKHLKQENNLLKAQVEALTTIHIDEKDKYDYTKADRTDFYELASYLLKKYNIGIGIRALLKVMRISESPFLKYRHKTGERVQNYTCNRKRGEK